MKAGVELDGTRPEGGVKAVVLLGHWLHAEQSVDLSEDLFEGLVDVGVLEGGCF